MEKFYFENDRENAEETWVKATLKKLGNAIWKVAKSSWKEAKNGAIKGAIKGAANGALDLLEDSDN